MRVGYVVMLALLAIAAIAATAIPVLIGALIFVSATLLVWRELIKAEPIRLRWKGDGTLWLDWADAANGDREQCVEPLAVHRVGALTVLHVVADGCRQRLTLWPDSLNAGDRKALRRRLLAGLPMVNSG